MGSSSEFVLVSDWRIAAPRASVWQALRRPCEWPAWWPYVKRVEELEHGNGGGVGARHRVHWTSRLPYSIHLVTRVVEVREPELIRVEAAGDLRGEGVWRLREEDGGTGVEYTWRVGLDKGWMRALAPLLRPVFAWNHNAVMAAGEQGLRGLLEGQG
jgi:uncharacterized protein YndB with AHSA1/START domain